MILPDNYGFAITKFLIEFNSIQHAHNFPPSQPSIIRK